MGACRRALQPGGARERAFTHAAMFHHVVPASALGPEAGGPPEESASVPLPASMCVYRVGPASAR